MASETRIPNGLALDFVPATGGVTDPFLMRDATTGLVTQTSTVPASRVSSGGNLTEVTSSVLTISGTGVLLSNGTIQVKQAGAGQSGYLSSTDWNTFNDKLTATLTSGRIFVGNGSNVATGVDVTGDVTISNAGVTAIGAGVIVNADINASAAIAVSKLAAMSASLAVVTDGSGFLTTLAGLTTTKLGYVTNVTGDIQSQLDTTNQRIVGIQASATLLAPGAGQDQWAIVWDEGTLSWTLSASGGGGTLVGPGSSTDNAISRWNGTGGDALQNSGVIIDDTDNITGVASITVNLAGLHLLDTDASHDLIVVVGSDLSADRNLTITTGDASRTITLSGDTTLDDWFDQSVKTTADAVFASATLSNAGGLHILDSDSSHDLIFTTASDLTADRTLTINTGDASRTVIINTSGTFYITGGTDVALADGGTGASLSDPNYDAFFVWDNTAGLSRLAQIGSGLSYDTYTNILTATGGGGGHVIENNGTPLTARANLNFRNGLSATDNTPDTDAVLGGTLIQNTTIDAATFTFTITTTGGSSLSINDGSGALIAGNPGNQFYALENGGLLMEVQDDAANFLDNRVVGFQTGLEYSDSAYGADFTDATLIHRLYADGRYWSLASGGTLTGANNIIGSTSNTLTFTFNGLNTTITDGAGHWLRNTTAAASGLQQISPITIHEGQGWKTNATAASQSVVMKNYVLPVQGTANPSGTYMFDPFINGSRTLGAIAAIDFNATANTLSGLSLRISQTDERGFFKLNVTSGELRVGTGTGYFMSFYGGTVEAGRINTTGNWAIGSTTTSTAKFYITHTINALVPVLRVDAPANTNKTASTEFFDINFNLARTDTWATGALTTQRWSIIQAPTIAFVGASTLTDGYTFYVTGGPTAGTNATITRSWAAGFGGNVFIGTGTPTTGSVLLELSSTSRALLLSRVTDIASVTTPVNGMMAYDASTDKFNFRQAAAWRVPLFLDGANVLTANTSITGAFDFEIGTSASAISNIRLDASSTIVIDSSTSTTLSSVNVVITTSSQAVFNTNNGIKISNSSTPPTVGDTDCTILYSKDVASSSELFVMDEAGNETQLSPHYFGDIPGGASEDMAWSYYSNNYNHKKSINVDMLAVVRAVEDLYEKMTGEKKNLAFIKNL